MHLRVARPSEKEELEGLQRRASLENPGDRESLLAHPDAIEVPREQLEAGCVVVAEAEGTVLGFAAVVRREDGDAELDALFVEPGHWRRGIGRRLVARCGALGELQGAKALNVVANPHAKGFYAACGFEVVGTTTTRFGSALLMRMAVRPGGSSEGLGVEPGENYLVPHDPRWSTLFDEEARSLRAVLPPEAVEIQHVGSTAVPGLHAKPIIDIAIAARSHRLADEWQAAMGSLGYDYPGDIGIPEHRIYGRDPEMRRFLVHVVDGDGHRWADLLRFRDLLRQEPRLAAAYQAVKEAAAARYPRGPRGDYTSAKAGFIEHVLARKPDRAF